MENEKSLKNNSNKMSQPVCIPKNDITKDKQGDTYPGFFIIQHGPLTEKQVRNVINALISKLHEKYPDENIGEHYLFLRFVMTKEKKPLGLSYAYIDNYKIYNALIGKNFDGTDRYEEYDDMDWTPPEEDKDEALSGITNWGDIDEVENKYTRPKLRKALPPLIEIPPIKLNSTQIETLKREKIEAGKDPNTVKELLQIMIMQTILKNEEEEKNILTSIGLPKWVTEKNLYNFFSKFNMDDNTYHETVETRDKKKIKKPYRYPKIELYETRGYNNQQVKACKIIFSSMYPTNAKHVFKLCRILTREEFEGIRDGEILHFKQFNMKFVKNKRDYN